MNNSLIWLVKILQALIKVNNDLFMKTKEGIIHT